jgi:hypothetical protein
MVYIYVCISYIFNLVYSMSKRKFGEEFFLTYCCAAGILWIWLDDDAMVMVVFCILDGSKLGFLPSLLL